MKVHNAIYIREADNVCLVPHLQSLAALGRPIDPWLYYGLGDKPPVPDSAFPFGWVELGCVPGRDNMGLKTFGLMQHALALPGWSYLFKTDCNVQVTKVAWDKVAGADYAGCVVTGRAGREYKNEDREPLLREPYRGTMAHKWCGGSGYIVSRRLAQLVVHRGAWWCRGHYAEDQMVAIIAEEAGIKPVPAVQYHDGEGLRGFTHP
jgi:hypothetical protein